MVGRYCILTTPRSGSTVLEDIIHNNLLVNYPDSNPLKLGEWLHWWWYQEVTSDGKIIGDHKRMIVSDQYRGKIRDNILNLVKNSVQPMTMRIFPQLWFSDYFDFQSIINTLKDGGFTFIFLKRNFLDSLLSFLVADHTDIWHKLNINGDISYTYHGVNQLVIPGVNNKIKVRLKKVPELWIDIQSSLYMLGNLEKQLPGVVINYSTLFDDIDRLGLSRENKTIYEKTYQDLDYSNIIENYGEVVDIINWLGK